MDRCRFNINTGAALDRCGEEGAEPEGKASNLRLTLTIGYKVLGGD